MADTTETTNIDILVNNVEITKTFKVSPDKDSTESKKVTLTSTFNNVPLRAIFLEAMKPEVIRLQGSLRKAFDTLEDGLEITKAYKSTMQAVVITPEMAEKAFLADLAKMTVEEREAKLAEMVDQIETD